MTPPESILFEKWMAGRDADAFAEIVANYSGMVFGTCRRILGNASEAEDVTQECFIELAQRGAAVKHSLGGWLHTVAVRRSLDRMKSEQRRKGREAHFMAESEEAREPTWDDVQVHIDDAIAQLPENLRGPVIMRFLQGQTHEAIAETLDIPRSTVQHRIAQGLEQVRKVLKKRGILVGSALLLAMLGSNTASAAPPALTAALGKMVIAASIDPFKTGLLITGTAATAKVATLTGTAAVAKTAAVAACSAAIVSGLIYAAAVLSMNNGARTPEKGEWAIRGSVVNSEGEPMPATRVEARREDGRGETFDTVTDAQGRFAIERLAGGEYVVAAINEAGGLGYMEKVPAGLPKTVVALKAGGTIAGRVYDEETGKGIANALVGAVPRDQSYSSALVSLLKQMHVDKTDADGYYTLNVAAPEKYTVAIRDAGAYIFAPPVRQGVALDEGQTRDSVDFPVSCDGSVSGTVTTGTGGAAPNTEVTLINLSCGVLQRTVTDGSGHYAFSGLRMRKGYSILARHNTLGAFALGPVDLTPNQTETALHIRLGAPSGK